MVHPNHQLTRNAQHGLNDFVTLQIKAVCSMLVSKSLSLSKENMKAILPDLISGELQKYALSECEKTDNCIEELLSALRSYMVEAYPGLCRDSKSDEWQQGLLCCSKYIEYLCSETLEYAGNTARDFQTNALGLCHFCAAVKNDDELYQMFQHVTFGQLLPTLPTSMSNHSRLLNGMLEGSKEARDHVLFDDFVQGKVSAASYGCACLHAYTWSGRNWSDIYWSDLV
jgi:hypothetical protein